MQIKDPIIFLVGAAIGSGITFLATKKVTEKKAEEKAEAKYEAQYQEELRSVKESFAYLAEEDRKKAEAAKNKPPVEDVYEAAINESRAREAAAEAKKINYSDPQSISFEEEEFEDDANTPLIDTTIIDEDTDTSQPYILKRIPDDEDYTRVNVTFYADGTYADSRDTEMEIEEYIGKKMMDYVSHTDKDEIFIRNEELGLDIDITKDTRTYDEVMFG